MKIVQIFINGEEQFNLDNIIIENADGELVNKEFTMRVWKTISVSADKIGYYSIEGPKFVSDITKDDRNDYHTDYTIPPPECYAMTTCDVNWIP